MARTDTDPSSDRSKGAAAVVEPSEPNQGTAEPKRLVTVDKEYLDEILRRQNQTDELLRQFMAQAKAPQRPGLSMPTGRPIIARATPPNYVVWLGPEPPSGGELCRPARGVMQTFTDDKTYTMTDGDGRGIKKTVKGTTHSGVYGEYVDAGVTSIEFKYRCPTGHKHAGKLYAEILCPEHAAYLHLTAPDGKGRDRDGNKLYAFHLTHTFAHKYEALKRFRLNQRRMEEQDVDWVASDGVEMPPEGES